MKLKRLLLLVPLLLAACGGGDETAVPAPDIRVGLSYATQAQRSDLLACIPANLAGQVAVELVLADSNNIADYALLIRMGESQALPQFAAALGEDQVVALVHPDNPLDELSRSQLAEIFSGRITNWSVLGGEDGAIQLWIPLAGDEARGLFRQAVLQGAEFSGAAQLAASPQLMLDAVAADPGAIGLLPASLLTEAVHAIDTGIRSPVLALAGEQPNASLEALVGCMQER